MALNANTKKMTLNAKNEKIMALNGKTKKTYGYECQTKNDGNERQIENNGFECQN